MFRLTARSLGVLVALACSLPASSSFAAPLLGGLGGPAGYGSGNLPANDDGSSSEIGITAAFPSGLRFFGSTFTSLYVNNNGNVSFGGSNGTYTPQAFPVASLRMIAPWWGDVDTRGGGVPNRNGVYWSITPGRFVATWHNVGYYSHHDDLQNDFQLILTAAGPGRGDFDVEFRYNRCQWTTGDASGGSGGFGGTPAQAGFDAGNLRDYVTLPGSRTREVLRLCTTSNVGIAGVWRYAIRDGEVNCPGAGAPCGTGRPGVCAMGTVRCRGTEALCIANAEPGMEACNGQDDDCDGVTDEDLGTLTCGAGACIATVEACVSGTPQRCVPLPPSPEVCNGIDDDCNELTDDLADVTCGVGACSVRVPACGPACVPLPGSPEICNGQDDDCDGLADDGLVGCEPPDAGPPDASVIVDASVADAGCRGACDPFRLGGRAGPIGCHCRASAGHTSAGSLSLLLVALALVRLRRRREPVRS
ncbi:MAG: hypothetical protein IT378_18885 [Sandaracinaceae bacterium]|nr:hypothetical protein [Sandaracinaceae bacterium]